MTAAGPDPRGPLAAHRDRRLCQRAGRRNRDPHPGVQRRCCREADQARARSEAGLRAHPPSRQWGSSRPPRARLIACFRAPLLLRSPSGARGRACRRSEPVRSRDPRQAREAASANPLKTLFHGPNPRARSRHGTPVRSRHRPACTNRRTSRAVTPRSDAGQAAARRLGPDRVADTRTMRVQHVRRSAQTKLAARPRPNGNPQASTGP